MHDGELDSRSAPTSPANPTRNQGHSSAPSLLFGGRLAGPACSFQLRAPSILPTARRPALPPTIPQRWPPWGRREILFSPSIPARDAGPEALFTRSRAKGGCLPGYTARDTHLSPARDGTRAFIWGWSKDALVSCLDSVGSACLSPTKQDIASTSSRLIGQISVLAATVLAPESPPSAAEKQAAGRDAPGDRWPRIGLRRLQRSVTGAEVIWVHRRNELTARRGCAVQLSEKLTPLMSSCVQLSTGEFD